MGTCSGGATLQFSVFLAFQIGVNSDRKEFAPTGANSFLEELTLFWKSFVAQGSKQKVAKVIYLCKNSVGTSGVSILYNMISVFCF